MDAGKIARADCCFSVPWDGPTEWGCLYARSEDGQLKSVWIPSPEEVARIIAGGPIILSIWGRTHPAVSMSVGDASEVVR